MPCRSSHVRHHPHSLFIRLWDEANKRSRWPGDHCGVRPVLPPAVPLPVRTIYLPGGRLHRSDWLHGLESHRGAAADQRPLDLDQAVGLPGRRALHGLWSHHRRQQVLLPRAPLPSHHHGHLLRRPDANSSVRRRVPGCGGFPEENMRWRGLQETLGWGDGSNSGLEWSWTHLTARSQTPSLHLGVALPHNCYHGNWSATRWSPCDPTSMVVSYVSLYKEDTVVLL